MGQNESKQIESKQIEPEEVKIIRQLQDNGGAKAVFEYLEKRLNEWENEKVDLAITGRSATGKSTFINKIRGVKPNDESFAPQGSGDTTQKPTCYPHPQNKNIRFWDLPGIGTLKVPSKTYADKMEFAKYDIFLIFFMTVLEENDLLVAREILERRKKFRFVRSKLDIDLDNCEEDGVSEKDKKDEIKKKVEGKIKDDDVLSQSKAIFYISSKKTNIGDMNLLLEYIERQLSDEKREAFVNTLTCISNQIIDEKYYQLKSRLVKVTALAAAVSALPVPGLDLAINLGIIVKEINHYINVFGLTLERLGTIYDEENIELNFRKFLVNKEKLDFVILETVTAAIKGLSIMAIESVADVFFPFVGAIISAPTTALIVYNLLSSYLDKSYKDAKTVHDHIEKKL